VNNRGADDTERDLLDARHRSVEHRPNRKSVWEGTAASGCASDSISASPMRCWNVWRVPQVAGGCSMLECGCIIAPAGI
jgi:hypothetical protein